MGNGRSQRKRFAIAIGPAVAVGVLHSVQDAVSIGVGIGRVGDRAGGLAGSVIAVALGADTGNRWVVFDYSVKGRIHVTDEVFESITIGVDRGVGVSAGGAPAHF